MKSFKKSFFDLIDQYKTLPYMDEQLIIAKGKLSYKVILEINESTNHKQKPTHKSVAHLLEYLQENKDKNWIPADNPSNDPPLLGFISDNCDKDFMQCTISLFCINKATIEEQEKVNRFRLNCLKKSKIKQK